jgi:Tol biopolymer transport system component
MALASLVMVPLHDRQRTNLDAPYVSVSGDGRYVALTSQERLVSGDVNNRRDVYVLDRAAGSVTLESVTPDEGVFTEEDTDRPAISGDGRFLVYESGDRVIWRDRETGTAIVLGKGREPAISGDSRFAAFTSADGVMLFEVATHAIRNVSVDGAGRTFPNASGVPALSGDGRYVAFASTAPLTPAVAARAAGNGGGRRPFSQIYLRDLQLGTTKLVSVSTGGKPANGDSWSPSISGDGCALVFVSGATNLVKSDRNRSADVFAVNLVSPSNIDGGGIELVSRYAKGDAGNGASARPTISADGRFVAFQSEASDLAKPDADINLLWDVFLFDRREGRTTRLSTDPEREWMEASGGPGIDASGGVVAFSSRHPMSALDKRNDFDLFVLTTSHR